MRLYGRDIPRRVRTINSRLSSRMQTGREKWAGVNETAGCSSVVRGSDVSVLGMEAACSPLSSAYRRHPSSLPPGGKTLTPLKRSNMSRCVTPRRQRGPPTSPRVSPVLSTVLDRGALRTIHVSSAADGFRFTKKRPVALRLFGTRDGNRTGSRNKMRLRFRGAKGKSAPRPRVALKLLEMEGGAA